MSTRTERWNEISALFDELVDVEPLQRADRLAQLALSDPALADEVRALLVADASDAAVLDGGVSAAVPQMLASAVDSAPADGLTGPYRLLREIGEGGMGVVWLAERTDGAYEQQVAVKLLKRGMDTQAILRRFLQERRILARLHHAHIVRLLDGGMSADGRPFYVMDYVDGPSITRYAAQHALDVRARVELLVKVTEAVGYAHAQLVVHRDLKPSNVLVDADGDPRVLDFGIAKLIEESGEQTLTGTGLRVLSPAYAAPEQILGEPIGTAADVYALGLMLCELLTGELPQRRRAAQLTQDAAEETSARASTLAARLPPERIGELYGRAIDARRLGHALAGDLDLIIATALQREPVRRYPSALAFAGDLKRWLQRRPIAARADSKWYRLRRFVRRNRVAVGAAVVVVVALVAGLALALWQARVARMAEARAQQQAEIASAVSEFLTRDVIQSVNPFRNTLDIRLADALIAAGTAIDARFAGKPRLAGVLHRELADALYLAAEMEPAEQHARQALMLLERHFGATDADALQARVLLGHLLHKQDRDADAGKLFGAGLQAMGSADERPLRLELELGLAGVEVEQRREAEALAMLDRLEPRIVAAFGEYTRQHMTAIDHRMRALINLERNEDLLKLVQRVQAGTEAKYGVGDTQTLEWVKRHGITLVALERYDEAEVVLRQACAATRANLGVGHYASADCDLRHGIALFELKRYTDALPLMQNAVAVRSKLLGADAEGVWIANVWLARVYQKLDREPEARALHESNRKRAEQAYGVGDPQSLPFVQTLGMFLEQTGAYTEALTLRREILDLSKRAFPDGHINIAKYAWDLGETLASLHRDEETLSFHAEWLPQWERHFGTADSRSVDAHQWLAAAQQRLGR